MIQSITNNSLLLEFMTMSILLIYPGTAIISIQIFLWKRGYPIPIVCIRQYNSSVHIPIILHENRLVSDMV